MGRRIRLSKPRTVINPYLGKLKSYTRMKIPKGFILVVDTREQLPLWSYEEGKEAGIDVVKGTLHNGDYSIRGFEERFCIERKMIGDFYGYIGSERDKTVKKMNGFRDIVRGGGWVGLCIEASEEEILYGHPMSTMSPETARQAINSFRVRYGVHVYYGGRDGCRRFVMDMGLKFYQVMREGGGRNKVKKTIDKGKKMIYSIGDK